MWTTASTTGWQAEVIRHHHNNPNRGSQLLTLGRVIHRHIEIRPSILAPLFKGNDFVIFLNKLHARFGKVIEKKFQRYLNQDNYEKASATLRVQELIRRGFVHEQEMDLKVDTPYLRGLQFYWPQPFEDEAQAEEFNARMGIPGTIKPYSITKRRRAI
jgi:hypothetical protein